MITLPNTEQAKQQERNIILTVAKNNVFFPLQIIHKLKNNIILKTQIQKSHQHKHNKRKNWSPSHITVHSHTKLPIYLKILT